MRRPIVAKESLDLQSNHFLRRSPGYPLGIPLGELDYLRGWKDDFLGDEDLFYRYVPIVVGAGSTITMVGGAHGGWVNLTAGAAATRYARLWLGDAADSYATLDADEGYVIFVRMRVNASIAGDFLVAFGARNVAGTRVARCGIHSWVIANNWSIEGTDGGGTTRTDTTVAFDTDWHWHGMSVYPTAAGRQIDYWLDGSLIGSHTTNVPTDVLTPFLSVYSLNAVIRTADFDYWAVIPRNL